MFSFNIVTNIIISDRTFIIGGIPMFINIVISHTVLICLLNLSMFLLIKILRLFLFSYINPISMNMIAEMMPCLIIIIFLCSIDNSLQKEVLIKTMDICLMEKIADIFFRSVERSIMILVIIIPVREMFLIIMLIVLIDFSIIMMFFSNPIVPSLRRIPAKIIEPQVLAST